MLGAPTTITETLEGKEDALRALAEGFSINMSGEEIITYVENTLRSLGILLLMYVIGMVAMVLVGIRIRKDVRRMNKKKEAAAQGGFDGIEGIAGEEAIMY